MDNRLSELKSIPCQFRYIWAENNYSEVESYSDK